MAVKEVNTKVTENDNIIDVDLSVIKKQRFRINRDNSKILELNTSDMGIIARLDEMYPKLMKLQEKVTTLADMEDDADGDAEILSTAAKKLTEIDAEMREAIDYIFQSNVSEVCGSEGSMYDPIDGVFRYEHIIETLSRLYTNNFESEFKKMKSRVNKRASQYTKKRK